MFVLPPIAIALTACTAAVLGKALGLIPRTVSTVSTSALLLASPAMASEDRFAERAGEIVQVMQGARPTSETFTDPFLADVPAEKLAALSARLQAESGALVAAEGVRAQGSGKAAFTLRFARGYASAQITLEGAAPFKVRGLRIGAVIPFGDNGDRLARDFAALPGRAGFAVVRLGERPEVLAGLRADDQFAIGSAFKLWVLDALAGEVTAGRRRWDEVVRLGPRSLPGGMTQDWPEGAPVTVETLATLMMSISDNTATDTLIRLIGRERIAARVRAIGHSDPARTLPLPTTAESFALKLSPPALREAYARADEAGRARILAGLDAQKIIAEADPSLLDARPVAIDSIEWFASPADIARVLDSLRRRTDPRVLAILGVAPNLPLGLSDAFRYAAYKGGSETGVLNLTWLVQARQGDWFAVTASWNDVDRPLASGRLQSLAERLLRGAALRQSQTIAP